jgi:hypothetical protein
MLEGYDPVVKEWSTKYPGFNNRWGEGPGCWAIEYESDTESSKDSLSGSFGRCTSITFYIVHDFVAMSFGQW